MSQENVEEVRRATEAFSGRDVGFLDNWATDAVVDWSRSHGLDAAIYRGHADIQAFAERFWGAFEDLRIELLDLVEIEEGVLVADHITHLRGRDGVEVQARGAWLITFRGGRQTSLTLYQTKQEALEAVGSSE